MNVLAYLLVTDVRHEEESTMLTLATLEAAADHGPPMPLPTGAQAREIREAAGVTATAVAAAVGIGERTVNRFEREVARRFGSPAVDIRYGRVLRTLRDYAESIGEPAWFDALSNDGDIDHESDDDDGSDS